MECTIIMGVVYTVMAIVISANYDIPYLPVRSHCTLFFISVMSTDLFYYWFGALLLQNI